MSSPGGGTSGSRQACGKGGKSARVEHAATRQLAQPASLRGWGSVYQCTSRKTSGSQLTRESRQQPGHREPVLLGRLTPVGIQASTTATATPRSKGNGTRQTRTASPSSK